MKLSKNFSLEEFLVSQTAVRHGLDMTPPRHVIENIQKLVTYCLQPLRHQVNRSIFISSGYRPPELNSLIGGSLSSRHMTGEAADFRVAEMTPFDTCELIVEMDLPFDQLIQEFGSWTHLGMSETPRGEQLTAYKDGTKTRYTHGIHRMDSLQ